MVSCQRSRFTVSLRAPEAAIGRLLFDGLLRCGGDAWHRPYLTGPELGEVLAQAVDALIRAEDQVIDYMDAENLS